MMSYCMTVAAYQPSAVPMALAPRYERKTLQVFVLKKSISFSISFLPVLCIVSVNICRSYF